MQQYKELLQYILDNGVDKADRTGTGTRSVFGYQNRYNLSEGFPIVTIKRTYFKAVVHELLWFLQGSTNTKYLKENNVTIWDEWARPDGELGPIYGKQWRKWEGDVKSAVPNFTHKTERLLHGTIDIERETIDQIAQVIEQIKTNPDSRRLIVSAWNVADLNDMALMPCHAFFQFYVANGKLSCHLYQRSADAFLGVPFNIASYALLTHMIAQVTDYNVGEFIHSFGDLHIYNNHLPQVEKILKRDPKPLPKLLLNPEISDIDDFQYSDIKLDGYESHSAVKGEVAI